MTVLETIQRSVDFLAKKGVDSPRLQAELLLAHVLKVPRLRLYLEHDRQLQSAHEVQMRELIRRRGQREPLQHILGSTSFCGLELEVNRDVLIPRPETELLAELAWKYVFDVSTTHPTALDVGTGSGCLAISLAVKCPKAAVTAIDCSPAALAVARRNAVRHKVSDRIRFLEGDGFAAPAAPTRFNLIISNPPYIPSADIPTLQPEVRDHDPRLALDGGPDGLDFYRRLATEAAAFLESDGRLMLEFGDGQEESLHAIFEPQNWVVEAVHRDYNTKPRILVARVGESRGPKSGAN